MFFLGFRTMTRATVKVTLCSVLREATVREVYWVLLCSVQTRNHGELRLRLKHQRRKRDDHSETDFWGQTIRTSWLSGGQGWRRRICSSIKTLFCVVFSSKQNIFQLKFKFTLVLLTFLFSAENWNLLLKNWITTPKASNPVMFWVIVGEGFLLLLFVVCLVVFF